VSLGGYFELPRVYNEAEMDNDLLRLGVYLVFPGSLECPALIANESF
jgi:hypothetical protein